MERLAERLRRPERVTKGILGVADPDALPGGETVRLDDARRARDLRQARRAGHLAASLAIRGGRIAPRVYIGEIRWSGEWYAGTHEPLVPLDRFERANKIVTQRSEDTSLRRSNTSDFLLTGLLTCVHCGKKMIGTKAHGNGGTYHYYTCFTRGRYGTSTCDAERIPAREVESAVVDEVLAMLDDEPLVQAAVARAFESQETDRPRRQADLANVEGEIRKAHAALNRYLDAFENETMPEAVCAPRVAELGEKLRGLEARRAELTDEGDEMVTIPSEAELVALAAEVRQMVENGEPRQVKALVQAYVREIRVVSRAEIYPSFYVPVVSQPSGSVETVGVEPTPPSLQARRSSG